MDNAFNKLQILHAMLSNFLTNDKQVMQYKVAHLSHQNELLFPCINIILWTMQWAN